MQSISLSGSLRENVGKKDAKILRKKGMVPCVVYGGEDQVHFYMDEREIAKILFTPNIYLIQLQLDGKEVSALLQDVQYHPVSDRVLHADFLEVDSDKIITTTLPVFTTGIAAGVLKGGSMKQLKRKLAIRAIVADIPDFINVDISDLEIGDSIKIKDLDVDKVVFLDKPSEVVISVKVTRIAVEEEEEDEDEEGEEGEGGEGGEGAPGEGGDKPAEGGKKPTE
jgi:large subunit ribosomal protein L25